MRSFDACSQSVRPSDFKDMAATAYFAFSYG